MTTNEMFLDDALENGWGHGVIPNPVRVDNRNWALFADSQTIGFGAVDARIGFCQTKLFQTTFQILPRLKPDLLRCAFRRRLIGADEDMTTDIRDAQLGNDRF